MFLWLWHTTIIFLRHMTPCTLLGRFQPFGGTCCSLMRGERIYFIYTKYGDSTFLEDPHNLGIKLRDVILKARWSSDAAYAAKIGGCIPREEASNIAVRGLTPCANRRPVRPGNISGYWPYIIWGFGKTPTFPGNCVGEVWYISVTPGVGDLISTLFRCPCALWFLDTPPSSDTPTASCSSSVGFLPYIRCNWWFAFLVDKAEVGSSRFPLFGCWDALCCTLPPSSSGSSYVSYPFFWWGLYQEESPTVCCGPLNWLLCFWWDLYPWLGILFCGMWGEFGEGLSGSSRISWILFTLASDT